jgi:HAD superfamily hydrolase (TIGR01509 family)
MKFDFLILNIDATIFDVVKLRHAAYRNLAQRYAIDVSTSFLDRVMDARGSSQQRLDREFIQLAKLRPQADELFNLYVQESLAENRLLSTKAKTFLSYLERRQIPYGIVSSMPRSFVRQMSEKFDFFRPRFSVVQGEVYEGKPEPDLYLMACRKAGVHPNHALVIENSVLGAQSAFLAAAKVFFLESATRRNETTYAFSLQEFADLDEIENYLDKHWDARRDEHLSPSKQSSILDETIQTYC